MKLFGVRWDLDSNRKLSRSGCEYLKAGSEEQHIQDFSQCSSEPECLNSLVCSFEHQGAPGASDLCYSMNFIYNRCWSKFCAVVPK